MTSSCPALDSKAANTVEPFNIPMRCKSRSRAGIYARLAILSRTRSGGRKSLIGVDIFGGSLQLRPLTTIDFESDRSSRHRRFVLAKQTSRCGVLVRITGGEVN
jgi:hypothetical protein